MTAADNSQSLVALLDTLIPGGEGFPPASEVATRERLGFRQSWTGALDIIMAALPDEFATLGAADRRAVLEGLEQATVPAFQTLIEALYSAYYTDPLVLAATSAKTGYRNPPQPGGYALPEFDETVLATVRNNPQSWRPTAPEDQQGHA